MNWSSTVYNFRHHWVGRIWTIGEIAVIILLLMFLWSKHQVRKIEKQKHLHKAELLKSKGL
jgi:ABC-type polysaccharide/polyol phosphate export permease